MLVFPDFIEFHSPTFEYRMVFARQGFINQSVGGYLDSPYFLDDFFRQHITQ
jgi:hypothetical protein